MGRSTGVPGPTISSRLSAPASFAGGPALRAQEAAPVYSFHCEATFDAEPAAVWKVWTDVSGWPEWDLTKEIARMDGPFALGGSGWAKQRGNLGGSFTITAIEPGRRWVSECPVPLGKIVFDHLIEPAGTGQVRVTKSVNVLGGFGPLFRLTFGTKMRRDITASLEALGRHIRD